MDPTFSGNSSILSSFASVSPVNFKTIVRQQPNRARMSGMGDNVSRRMLDPPLIIQLQLLPPSPQSTKPTVSESIPRPAPSSSKIENGATATGLPAENSIADGSVVNVPVASSMDPSSVTVTDNCNTNATPQAPSPNKHNPSHIPYTESQLTNLCNYVICQVSLYHERQDKLMSFADIPPPRENPFLSRYVTILLGQTVRNCQLLDTEESTLKHLFVFSDLAVRIQGKFRICCKSTNLQSGRTETVFTDVFEVYSPQNYPGILEPTPLSKWLYIQGIQVRAGFHSQKSKMQVRMGKQRKQSTDEDESGEAGDHFAEEAILQE